MNYLLFCNSGVQLIERHEEVCLFYEKVNIQEDMIRRGDVDLHTREEEIRFLKMQVCLNIGYFDKYSVSCDVTF